MTPSTVTNVPVPSVWVNPGFVAPATLAKQHKQHKAIAPKIANNDFPILKTPL
jgi:hypothetical protein